MSKHTVKCLLCGETLINRVALITHSAFVHGWKIKYKFLNQKEKQDASNNKR